MERGRFLLLLGFLIILFFLSVSCKEETVTNYPMAKDGSEIPADLDTVKLNYESFFTVRYGLGYPFLKVKNSFYFFEINYLKMFKYNLIDSTYISNYTYNNQEYLSTQNYYFAAGDSIVMVSYIENNHSLNIYLINKETLSLKLLKKNLIIGENLYTSIQSSVLWDKNKIIILLKTADKILTIDMKTFALNYFQDYHLSGNRHDPSINLSVIMGKVGRDVYLYYYTFKRLFKFNLDSFTFNEITIPYYVSFRFNVSWDRGGMVNYLFCFWPNDSPLTFCYDINKNLWLSGGKNPFYQKGYAPFNYIMDDNVSFYQEGSVMKRISIK